MVTLRLAALVCALLAGPAAAAVAPKPAAVRSYERGARELEFARYSEATTALEAAIALDPIESPQPVARPSGMNFEPYLPHLALGIARCESGDLAGAVASWAESDRQGAALSARGAARLLQRRDECAGRHREELRAAEEALKSPLASDLRSEPVTLLPDARPQAEGSAPPTLSAATLAAEPLDASAEAALPAAAEPLPSELLRAAQELFDGRAARAYEILEGFTSERPRSRAQAHLLRAAASFALARLDPDAAAWIARAREERAAAKSAAPDLEPDRRFFSPAFCDFFRGGEPVLPPNLLAD